MTYTQAWSIYLEKIHKDYVFTLSLKRRLHWAQIQQFPLVWPDTCFLFTPGKEYNEKVGTDTFVDLVEKALNESNSVLTT